MKYWKFESNGWLVLNNIYFLIFSTFWKTRIFFQFYCRFTKWWRISRKITQSIIFNVDKGKVIPLQVHVRCGCKGTHIHSHGTKETVGRLALRSTIFTLGKILVLILQKAEWIPGPVWTRRTEEKSQPLRQPGIEPGLTSTQPSFLRLQLSGPLFIFINFVNNDFKTSILFYLTKIKI